MAQTTVTTCDGPGCRKRTSGDNARSAVGWLAVEIAVTREQTDEDGKVLPGAALIRETEMLHFHEHACLAAWASERQGG